VWWQAKHTVTMKTLQKYKIMRIRQKISFIAFQKRMTVAELFCSTILDSLHSLPPNNRFLPSAMN
jgi:hypothetical protein